MTDLQQLQDELDGRGRGPRVPLPAGGTDLGIPEAAQIIAYFYEHARGVWANAMLTVFAPGYKATKRTARGSNSEDH